MNNVVSIGGFDGLHLGHHEIISKVIQEAERKGVEPKIITFTPTPKQYFNHKEDMILMLSDEKSDFFYHKYGFQIAKIKFDKELANCKAPDFLEKYIRQIFGASTLILGPNHTFGYKAIGDFQWLKKNIKQEDFSFFQVPEKVIDGRIVSSSSIKQLLGKGKIMDACQQLGYPYFYQDTIVYGDKNGTKIGFPTCNFSMEESLKLIPETGIYASWVKYNQDFYKGMTYIGYRPTLNGSSKRFETHILGFDKMIYGEKLTVFFVEKMRDDKKLPDMNAMKLQLQEDKINIENCLKNKSVKSFEKFFKT